MEHVKTPRLDEEQRQKDVELIEKLYMESPFLDWTRFAESQGWHPLQTRVRYPVATWQAKKKREYGLKQADTLQAELYERGFKWHTDVIKTLENYPKANDMMYRILLQRMSEINKAIIDDEKLGPLTDNKGRETTRFSKYKSSELLALSLAVKAVSESKYKSLLLNNWSAEIADKQTNVQEELDVTKGRGLKLVVKGHPEGISASDFQKMMDEYLDKPTQPIEDSPDERQD